MCDEPTVYIVDDDQLARDSVRVLARSLDLKAETFASAEEFLDHYDPLCAGCLVTDLQMLGMSGMELQEKLAAKGIGIPVIIITAYAETPLTVKAVKKGAVTVLEKPCGSDELSDAILAAIAQDARTRTESALQQSFHHRLGTLSQQEQSVLEYMIEGTANKVTARRLSVSIRTIENRRQRIFEKTDTKSLAELIRLVVETRSNTAR
jgi:FixJ family two-component response regulator